jgi:hypothetical protein
VGKNLVVPLLVLLNDVVTPLILPSREGGRSRELASAEADPTVVASSPRRATKRLLPVSQASMTVSPCLFGAGETL